MRRLGLAVLAIVVTACSRHEQGSVADASPPEASAIASAAFPDPAPEIEPPPKRIERDAAAAVVTAALVWKPYRGDRFTVLFPGEPKVKELPVDEGKVGYTEASFDVPGGQVSFAAGFTDHTAEEVGKPEEFLDGRVNAPRRGTTDVLTKRSITLANRHPGRVLILRRNISGTPLRVYSRLYLVGQRLYSLIVSTLDEGGASEDVVKKFMDSFKLN
jgi:hypothetical protein